MSDSLAGKNRERERGEICEAEAEMLVVIKTDSRKITPRKRQDE